MKKVNKINGLIILVFAVFLILPALFGIIFPARTNSLIENRRLADLPSLPENIEDLAGFPDQLETYYQDHFGFRWSLLYLYRHIKYFIGDTSIDNAVFGKKQGWIFYSNKADGDVIGNYRNINRFSGKELEKFLKYLNYKQQWLKKQGIEYLFVIVPSKHYIYPEYLPDYIHRLPEQNVVTQLEEALKNNSKINYLNLRPALLDAKNKKQLLYFKSDTHWNYYGGNIGQFEIAKKLAELFPNKIEPILFNDEQFTEHDQYQGDLALYMGVGEYFTEEIRHPRFPSCTKIPDGKSKQFSTSCKHSGLSALIFRDSFFTKLQPYISQYFQTSTYIWKKMNLKQADEYINKHKPDIVIEEWVDRYLQN